MTASSTFTAADDDGYELLMGRWDLERISRHVKRTPEACSRAVLAFLAERGKRIPIE